MNMLDRFIATLSPQMAVKRLEAQDILSRKYAAAKQSPQTGFLPQTTSTQNREISESWRPMVSRTSQLVRDYPPFSAGINCYEAFLVGGGMRFQSAALGADGTPDEKIIRRIEDAWNAHAESIHFDQGRRNTFYDMQGLAARQQLETGDFIFRKAFHQGRPRSGQKSNFCLGALDPVQLCEAAAKDSDHRVIAGVEIKQATAEATRYHFALNSDEYFGFQSSEIATYDAQQIIHGYHMLRPNQVRGVTPFASSILLAYHLQDYVHAEITAQKANSKFLAFVTAGHGARGNGAGSFNNASYNEVFKKYGDALEYASLQFLEPNESVEFNNTTRSSQGLQDFTSLILRMTAAATGLPVEILSGDYRDLNYTTIRAARNDFKQALKPKWRRFNTQFNRPAFDEWLRLEWASGRINLPGYEKDPARYHRGLFVPEGIEQVDPVKETGALLDAVHGGLMSMQEAIMARGKDPERLLEDAKIWHQKLKENGLEHLWFNKGGGMFPLLDMLTDEEMDSAEVE